jgi:hypothetical protein
LQRVHGQSTNAYTISCSAQRRCSLPISLKRMKSSRI